MKILPYFILQIAFSLITVVNFYDVIVVILLKLVRIKSFT